MAKKKFQRPVSTTSVPSTSAGNEGKSTHTSSKQAKDGNQQQLSDVAADLQLLALSTTNDVGDALDIPGFMKDKQQCLITAIESTVPPDAPRLQLSAETEEWLFSQLKAAGYTRPSTTELQALLEARSLKKLNVVYCELLKLGFKVEEVVDAMRATGGYPISAVLDWMAINMPPERLPRSFYDKALYKQRSAKQQTATADVAATPAVAVESLPTEVDVKHAKNKSPADHTAHPEDGGNEMFGGMFSEASSNTTTSSNRPPSTNTTTKLIDLPIPKDWTGKYPKSIFIEWYRKELIRKKHKQCIDLPSCGITFQPIGKRAGNRLRITNETSVCPEKWSFDMPDTASCVTMQQAQHYASVMALYKLEPSSNLYRMLPPAYKDLWMDWKSEKTVSEEDASRQELLGRLATLRSVMALTTTDILGPNPSIGFESSLRENTVEENAVSSSGDCDNKSRSVYKGSQQQRVDLELKRQFIGARRQSAEYQKFLATRSQLPVFGERERILETIQQSSICLIVGETGSGKSTQTGQFILEEWLTAAEDVSCNIFVTQPRRISAISLAKRVSQEQGELQSIGEKGSLCGYQIRLENRTSQTTRLTFGTVGILLRRLISDPLLDGITHVIVDEIHERSIDIDFLLLLMKRLVQKRPRDLKLILMSATVNAELFVQYFNQCPVITVPGRTFPVQAFYLEDVVEMTGYLLEEESEFAIRRNILQNQKTFMVSKLGEGKQEMTVDTFYEDGIACEDDEALASLKSKCSAQTIRTLGWMNEDLVNYELIEALLDYIVRTDDDGSGSILIFLPGIGEIRELNDRLLANRNLLEVLWILPLHSSFSPDEQARVFKPSPSKNLRKVVLSTNIAETGVTIPDCTIVIDCGRVKELNFHQLTNTNRLMDVFVAQDSALQRRGRAGRVKPGTCFHLFTSFRYENRLRKETLPEILRQSLDEFILTLRLQAHTEPLREIFNLLITPPHQSALHHSIKRLQYIQALNTVEQLTPLGAQLGGFPADAHLAKMVLLGALFKCMDPVLTVAATLSYKSPFVRPFGKETEAGAARAKFKTGDSDFLSYWAVYSTWRRLRESNGGGMKESLKFCQQNFLNFNTLQAIDDLKRQFHEHLASIGAVPEPSRYTDEDLNANSRQLAVVNAVISAGLYPKIAIYENRSLTIYAAADYFRSAADDSQQPGEDGRRVSTTKKTVYIHPSSSIFRGADAAGRSGCLVYNTLLALQSSGNRSYLIDCAQAAVLPLIMFSGGMKISHLQGTVTIDGIWGFRVCAKTAVLLKFLKRAIDCELNSSAKVQQLILRLLVGN